MSGGTPVRLRSWIKIGADPNNVVDNQAMGMIGDGLELMKLANMGANADVHEKLGKFVEKAQELQTKVEALEEANKESC